MKYSGKVVCALGVVLFPVAAQASGFSLREYTGAAQSNALAGASASAEDISYMTYNPASLTRHAGENIYFGATAILPSAKFSSSGATNVFSIPISGGNGGDNVAAETLLPSVFYARQISDDWFLGASLTVPFGLVTEYDSDWVGRYHAIKSDIRTFNFNPVAAFKITPKLSVAGGIQIAYTRGKLSNAVDFGTLAFGSSAVANDGIATSEGDDLAFGYNFGFLMEIVPGTRVGAAYRSKLHNQLDGDIKFQNSALGDVLGGGVAFIGTGNRAELNLPESASIGIHHEFSPRFALMAEVSWTGWSRLEELRVQFDNPHQPDDATTYKWKDSIFYSIGGSYKANEKWTLQMGVAYDQSPVPDETRTPRIPDSDRTWLSFGARYQISDNSVLNIGYTHLFFKEASLSLNTNDPNNISRGNLNGSYDISTNILSVQFNHKF